jgi:hypothetical protein
LAELWENLVFWGGIMGKSRFLVAELEQPKINVAELWEIIVF